VPKIAFYIYAHEIYDIEMRDFETYHRIVHFDVYMVTLCVKLETVVVYAAVLKSFKTHH
jgi:hypothetical protein